MMTRDEARLVESGRLSATEMALVAARVRVRELTQLLRVATEEEGRLEIEVAQQRRASK